jgi:hypothetical protein
MYVEGLLFSLCHIVGHLFCTHLIVFDLLYSHTSIATALLTHFYRNCFTHTSTLLATVCMYQASIESYLDSSRSGAQQPVRRRCHIIIDTIIHHILNIHTNDAYTFYDIYI